MKENYTVDAIFEKINYTQSALLPGEYEHCQFIHCDFSETNLSLIRFTDCIFSGCNLSLVKLGKTVLMDVFFKDCKMLGLQFNHCSGFGLRLQFEHCNLQHSSFYQVNAKETQFKKCTLKEVDFTEADLSNAVWDDCDLENAHFENTILEKADFRTARHFIIDPDNNRIKKAKFSPAGLPGLLYKYDIDIS